MIFSYSLCASVCAVFVNIATTKLTPLVPLGGYPFSCCLSRFIDACLSTQASKKYSTLAVVDEVTQDKKRFLFSPSWLHTNPLHWCLRFQVSRPASPFILHETILTYGNGGCCISWRWKERVCIALRAVVIWFSCSENIKTHIVEFE